MHPEEDFRNGQSPRDQRKVIGLVAGALAGLGLATSAFAQVISDPTGNNLFAIGTAGENTYARELSLSNGGTASSSGGASVSVGGAAYTDGLLAISLGPIANGWCCITDTGAVAVAANPTGDATACGMEAIAIAPTGTASGCGLSIGSTANGPTGVGVYGATSGGCDWYTYDVTVWGDAAQPDCSQDGGVFERLAISVFGNANSCAAHYVGVAVSVDGAADNCAATLYGSPPDPQLGVAASGDGPATSSAENGVAVSGLGSASGTLAGASAGSASGFAAVSGERYAQGQELAVSGDNADACGGPEPIAIAVAGKATHCGT